jgi:hypothetical protein
MNVNVGYNVVLPPEYDSHPNARFPVVYVLHGAGADENCFLLAIGLNPPATGYINVDQYRRQLQNDSFARRPCDHG